jgi:hypothetical protein
VVGEVGSTGESTHGSGLGWGSSTVLRPRQTRPMSIGGWRVAGAVAVEQGRVEDVAVEA